MKNIDDLFTNHEILIPLLGNEECLLLKQTLEVRNNVFYFDYYLKISNEFNGRINKKIEEINTTTSKQTGEIYANFIINNFGIVDGYTFGIVRVLLQNNDTLDYPEHMIIF